MRIICVMMVLINATVFSAVAHDPKIATFTLRDTGAGWLMEMNFAQAAVDAAMIELYGIQNLKRLDKKSYRDKVVDYVKSNFRITIDGKSIKLGSGAIVLGSHQTDMRFVLPEIPLDPTEAHVYIPMFGFTYNQTNLFQIYRGGKNVTKFFLTEENDFEIVLRFTPYGIFAEEKETYNQAFILSGSGLMLAIVIVIICSRKIMKG